MSIDLRSVQGMSQELDAIYKLAARRSRHMDDDRILVRVLDRPSVPKSTAGAKPAAVGDVGRKAGLLAGTTARKVGLGLAGAGLAYGAYRGIKHLTKPKTSDEKTAAEVKPEPRSGPGAILAKSLLGMGVGMTAGYAVPHGIDALVTAARGRPIMPSSARAVAPFVGGAVGLAAPLFQYAILQRMREEHARNMEAAQSHERKNS